MLEIVDDMRAGTCELESLEIEVDNESMERLQYIADCEDLSIDEVVACIVDRKIITYPDGTYDIADE